MHSNICIIIKSLLKKYKTYNLYELANYLNILLIELDLYEGFTLAKVACSEHIPVELLKIKFDLI